MANRKRGVQLHFMATEHEMELIHEKMAQIGTQNMGAYLRKMAVDGYVVNLDLSDVKELVSLLRRCSNNLNQLTRRVNEIGNVYEADIEDLRQNYDQLWETTSRIMRELADIN